MIYTIGHICGPGQTTRLGEITDTGTVEIDGPDSKSADGIHYGVIQINASRPDVAELVCDTLNASLGLSWTDEEKAAYQTQAKDLLAKPSGRGA